MFLGGRIIEMYLELPSNPILLEALGPAVQTNDVLVNKRLKFSKFQAKLLLFFAKKCELLYCKSPSYLFYT